MTRRTTTPSKATAYLGYRDVDTDTPFASYFTPELAPLAPHVIDALNAGPQAGPLLTDLESVDALIAGDAEPTETGYALMPDGSMRVAVLTYMPDVTPRMWDWWFGWHGDDTRKYKLWHPRAHLAVQWSDSSSRPGVRSYVGRTSFVEEYLGSQLARAAIRFIPPAELGVDERELANPEKATAICARVGFSAHPLDAGYLVHHVRRTSRGSEMRSRFWLGGRHAALRTRSKTLARPLPALATKASAMTAQNAADLLVHCAQEMAHLAAFLPALYESFGDAAKDEEAARTERGPEKGGTTDASSRRTGSPDAADGRNG